MSGNYVTIGNYDLASNDDEAAEAADELVTDDADESGSAVAGIIIPG